MRRALLLVTLVVPSSALAQPSLPPLDTGSAPACAALAAVPPDAKIPRPAVGARLSFANCAAMAKLSALPLKADDASVEALARAAQPSLDMLQAVIDQNDPVLSPIAKATRADLYVGMAVRLRDAVPSITMQTVGAALAEYDKAHAFVESKVGPWLDKAHEK